MKAPRKDDEFFLTVLKVKAGAFMV